MPRLVKACALALGLSPALWLTYRALNGLLSANPVEDLLLTTGLWAFRFLLLSLAVTPVRRLTGWNRIIQFRRLLGLLAFFYAAAHVSIYIALDQGFQGTFILADIVKRPFITAGMVAFVLLIPLAITSTKGWIRRLGRRWQSLHRLVYVSAVAAALHFLWKVKVVRGEAVYYAVILALLLGIRVAWSLRARADVRRRAVRTEA
jgi:sulfoxide reductase heme-binding subunit YedZ